MIAVEGPFAEEAKECLADPPRDHNDSDGNRMASHERAVILRKLIKKCPGSPEEKVYREHLKKAEDAYWRTVKETAVESGFVYGVR